MNSIETMLAIMLVTTMLLLIVFAVLKLLARAAPQMKFVSWYRQPLRDCTEYLAWRPPYDHGQYSSTTGEWHYVTDIQKAHLFDTAEEARAVTPGYDGSSGIASRSGVEQVIYW